MPKFKFPKYSISRIASKNDKRQLYHTLFGKKENEEIWYLITIWPGEFKKAIKEAKQQGFITFIEIKSMALQDKIEEIKHNA